ncbi:MAG: Tol-Pal system beta propeller repeat protein TolB [Deltaproteobacteria bacterium]|nr:Tol-Pal system beta propeller repeat protein TolB [Deltaproteobacteria bacterium]
MKRMKKITLLLICLLFWANSTEARIYIPIDQPADQKLPIAITPLVRLGGGKKLAGKIPEIIQNDLETSSYFTFIAPDAFLEPSDSTAITTEEINFPQWTAIEAKALIKGSVQEGDEGVVVELRLFDPFQEKMLVGKRYIGGPGDVRSMAHRFSDEVMLALTGIRGPFHSFIAYAAATGKSKRAIFLADYDGANTKMITDPKTVSFSPKFSPDGRGIIYTSYLSGRPEIYITDLAGNQTRLTRNGQSNITPAFSPDGRKIAFTSTVEGDPDLWLMNVSGIMIGKLAPHLGTDIAPAFSPNGAEMVFASERSGDLHLFKMNADGSAMKRLTFVGKFNDSPAWSPDGSRIAFCGRDRGEFDIFTMNADGSFIQRITPLGDGSNTHPSWSPDGRYLVFDTTRENNTPRGEPTIYIMRFDGANPRRVSEGKGMLPAWGSWR